MFENSVNLKYVKLERSERNLNFELNSQTFKRKIISFNIENLWKFTSSRALSNVKMPDNGNELSMILTKTRFSVGKYCSRIFNSKCSPNKGN